MKLARRSNAALEALSAAILASALAETDKHAMPEGRGQAYEARTRVGTTRKTRKRRQTITRIVGTPMRKHPNIPLMGSLPGKMWPGRALMLLGARLCDAWKL